MRLIGLHITKCAGTSLVSTIKRGLDLSEYYLCSSIYENIKQHHPEVFEREDIKAIRFIYGHYVHESLRSIFNGNGDIWFTILRDPKKRLKSEWYQIYKTRLFNNLEPMSVGEYLSIYSNSMCNEIIRAFPSAVDPSRSRLDAAKQALSNFHYVFDIEDFDKIIGILQDFLEIHSSQRNLIIENETLGNELLNNEKYLRSLDELEKAYDASLSDDALLYKSASISNPALIGNFEPLRGYDRWDDSLSIGHSQAMEAFMRHLGKYYRGEMVLAGGLAETSRQIDSRLNWLSFLRTEIMGNPR